MLPIHSEHLQSLALRIVPSQLPLLIRPFESAGTARKISLIASTHFGLRLAAETAGATTLFHVLRPDPHLVLGPFFISTLLL